MKKPLIGLTCEVNKLKPFYSEFNLCCDYQYVRAIVRAGGIPVLLPINFLTKNIKPLVKSIDGLVIIGGADISPRFYGETRSTKINPAYRGRVYFERLLYQEAVRQKRPVLGICYGMQLINIIPGGTLYQNIKTERKGSRNHRSYKHPLHPVEVQPGSLCNKIFNKNSFLVHSEHHHAVKTIGRSLHITAVSDDGLPEAIEKTPLVFAVQ
ncbi:MAG: gamma-glutamyl-gamma-aminobutyrate hydrolase family protein [bacterium]